MSNILPGGSATRAPIALMISALSLSGCTTIGSMMSPYSEKFSCKNSDHGQCIHPDKAYADAVAGVPSKSDPSVTKDKTMLRDAGRLPRPPKTGASAYAGYRESVYRELQGLVDAPVTPMLRQGRTVRTLIMPYADRERPDRLYMPRYVYSIMERPQWVVGDYLVNPVQPAARAPVLDQVREKTPVDAAADGNAAAVPALPEEARP
ncbi:TraV family lipoprotein [Sphingobium chungbukense]|uniref:Conjugal transfer protein TraV n=1 Tax=Sphingobium chungbukense TaxID=56193 RepID=A0A0M3AJL4_9SPHN|nr:TraV family lipoprotein [Sphingobium chungbukense]KKW90163.1 conjugal transfer protein TraV [Sphingobium chungbukense]